MSKKFLVYVLAIVFPIYLYALPSWLYHISHSKEIILGYGIDADLNKAKKNAIEEIANTLYVDIDSSLNISTVDKNGQIAKKSTSNIHTNTKAVLSGIEFIKIEKENGLWYVAAKYNNSSLDIKLKKRLPVNLKNESQNRYLANTPLILELNTEIGKKLNYKIIRKDNLWQLKYKDILLPLNEQNFYKLFSDQQSNKGFILANKKVYEENDNMYFQIKHTKKAYVSILYVEHNGKVGVLLSNTKSNKSFNFPNPEEESFKVANPYKKTIKELYVAIFSTKPVDLAKFENVSENFLDESNYNFDKLIELLGNYKYSTYKIKIKK